jgi:hypothetical protein
MSELMAHDDAVHVVMAIIVAIGIAIAIRLLTMQRGSLEVVSTLDGIPDLAVELLVDRRGRQHVGFAVESSEGRGKIRCCLSGPDARRLARMLRLAALPES